MKNYSSHSSDRFNFKSVWWVQARNSELQEIIRVSFFSHFELYFALYSCVLSTLQQHLLQFTTIRWRIRLFELKCNNQDDAFLISVLSEWVRTITTFVHLRRHTGKVLNQFIDPWHPNISLHILHSVLCTFPLLLTRRIWWPINSFFGWWSFLVFMWPQWCDSGTILWGEFTCWSLLQAKELKECSFFFFFSGNAQEMPLNLP